MRTYMWISIHRLLVSTSILGIAATSPAYGDTIIPITGIGTSLTSDYEIKSSVESVTYSDPVNVVIQDIPAIEIRGTVSGTGGSGVGLVPRPIDAHYHYDIPFVARWRKENACPRLVFFHHGGGVTLQAALVREKQTGGANPNRTAELNGDLLVGVPALLDGATYVSINRRGLHADGSFSATYLPSVSPLTATEVNNITNAVNNAAPPPGFSHPGVVAGAAVPVLPTNDATMCRDVARALEQVLAGIQGRPFRTRIAVGTSSGARVLAAMNFGRSVTLTTSIKTGGNHTVPYEKGSPKIFDGFILTGFPYAANVLNVEPSSPLSAPVMFFQGQGDERYQQHVTLAEELLRNGVVLSGRVWLYEIKNLTHVTRDATADTFPPSPSDGDRFGCFIGAAIRNLRCCLESGQAPPQSWMAGRIVDGSLRFDQAGGSTTNIAPAINDPSLDSLPADPMVNPKTIGEPEKNRWLAVTKALPHVADAITPPTVACRLGGYKLRFFGSELVPSSSADLVAKYGSFSRYRDGVCAVVNRLESQRLYDSRVEPASDTAKRARTLFNP